MVPENQYNLAGESSRPETAIHRVGLRCRSAAPQGGILLSRPTNVKFKMLGQARSIIRFAVPPALSIVRNEKLER
jgi:hypothetical protein